MIQRAPVAPISLRIRLQLIEVRKRQVEVRRKIRGIMDEQNTRLS
jgi:hypothetical protein